MKDPILIERMKADYTGFMHHEHKDHYPLRFFINRYFMVRRKPKKGWGPNSHSFYFVREVRRLDGDKE